MLEADRPVIVDYVEFETGGADAGTRLDVFVSARMPCSRSNAKRLIEMGLVAVDGEVKNASFRLKGGEIVGVEVPEEPPERLEPEDVPLDVIYEDDDMAAVNKPPGMAVHPSPGHARGTLAAALMHRFETLSTLQGLWRPGIVHRLDKDTSGVIIVAKNDTAHELLARQFRKRTIQKEYLAIVRGVPEKKTGSVARPIGHSIRGGGEMAVDGLDPKPARTEYETVDIAGQFALLRAFPHTGRTHQIRVHLAHIGCPILCDAVYGKESVFREGDIPCPAGRRTPEAAERILLSRQALHAARISFHHPMSRYPMTLEAPLPDDMLRTWRKIKEVSECRA